MDHRATLPRRPFGQTEIMVPPPCLGCAPLGDMPQTFLYSVPEERALATVRAALTGPLNYLDTSNSYSGGESERRIGRVLRELGGIPASATVPTKVDRDPATGDFSGPRMRLSLEESLGRLGQERLEIVFLHAGTCPLRGAHGTGRRGGHAAGATARGADRPPGRRGRPGRPADPLRRDGAFAAVLTHNRYTLLDRSAAPLLDLAAARGLAVLNAAPYGGGMLAKGPEAFPRYVSWPFTPSGLDCRQSGCKSARS